jgi:HEAT repeat protein
MTRPYDPERVAKYPRLAVDDAARDGDVAFLVEALADPEMRTGAAQRLGRLGSREAVPALVRNLRIDNDLTRNSIVIALAEIGDLSAAPALFEVAHRDDAAGVRTMAMNALAMLGDPRGVEMLTHLVINPDPLLSGTTRFFDAPLVRTTNRRRVRWWASKRLQELNATEAVPTLRASIREVSWVTSLRIRQTIWRLTR